MNQDGQKKEQNDEEFYDELIKQRIGEALRNQSHKERLDLAQLEAWVEADRQRKLRYRLMKFFRKIVGGKL